MTKTLHNEILSNKCLYKPLDEESLSRMVLIMPGHSANNRATKCKCSVIITCAVLGLIFFSFLSAMFQTVRAPVSMLRIESHKPPLHITDSKFLSIGLDSSVIADGFKHFDMGSEKLKKMMQHLSPGYLRVGGTLADRLLFTTNDSVRIKLRSESVQDGGECAYEYQNCFVNLAPNFTMSGLEWLQLNQLAAESGFIILFDLNSLIRHDDGSWNSTNAEELIRFSDQHNLTVIWELGNEPSAFQHVFNYTVNATQLAKDFQILRSILDRYPRYKKAFLVGPDVTRPRPENEDSMIYLNKFLADAGNIVNAVTWHQYYFNGRTATASDFLDPATFDLLASQTDKVIDIVRSNKLPNTDIWLGETAAAYGGGAPGFNNRYIGSFIWLDKLGIAAKKGLSIVVRQAIFKGYYALLDNNYDPTPDYWIGVLYKMLVGPEVVSCYTAMSPKVRLYCQCTNREFSKSSVTVYGMNMQDVDAVLRIQQFTSGTGKVLIYALTSHLSILSKDVYLNKQLLAMDENGNLPSMKPHVLHDDGPIIMPPYSLIFIVIPSDGTTCVNE